MDLLEIAVVQNGVAVLALLLGLFLYLRTRNSAWFLPSVLLLAWNLHAVTFESFGTCFTYTGFLMEIVQQCFAVAVLILPAVALLVVSKRPERVTPSVQSFFYSTLLALATVALDVALLVLFASPGVEF